MSAKITRCDPSSNAKVMRKGAGVLDCEPCPGYYQARLCPSVGALQNVWMTAADRNAVIAGGPSFELGGVCYYFDPADSPGTPGAVYPIAAAVLFASCTDCAAAADCDCPCVTDGAGGTPPARWPSTLFPTWDCAALFQTYHVAFDFDFDQFTDNICTARWNPAPYPPGPWTAHVEYDVVALVDGPCIWRTPKGTGGGGFTIPTTLKINGVAYDYAAPPGGISDFIGDLITIGAVNDDAYMEISKLSHCIWLLNLAKNPSANISGMEAQMTSNGGTPPDPSTTAGRIYLQTAALPGVCTFDGNANWFKATVRNLVIS